jgi:uncharacterized protein YndB with AHSA1/START domain
MEFLLPDGSVMLGTRVLSVTPKSRLEVDFRPAWGEDRTPTRVVYHVAPEGDACRLTIEHWGLSALQGGVADGWARVASGLKSHLETGRAERFPLPREAAMA